REFSIAGCRVGLDAVRVEQIERHDPVRRSGPLRAHMHDVVLYADALTVAREQISSPTLDLDIMAREALAICLNVFLKRDSGFLRLRKRDCPIGERIGKEACQERLPLWRRELHHVHERLARRVQQTIESEEESLGEIAALGSAIGGQRPRDSGWSRY